MNNTPANVRLDGLDLARFLALVGMVIVNFDIVMTQGPIPDGDLLSIAKLLQGRAAATFIVLAGIGFGLNAAHDNRDRILGVTLRRAAFLLALGLLNSLIFSADIIHYYAFYFLFGVLFLRALNWLLWVAMAGLVVEFMGMVFLFDYSTGWTWETLQYSGFWTVRGFIRNLFFNGWHPIFPWFAVFLFGLWLSRLVLSARKTQMVLVAGGALGFFAATALSRFLTRWIGPMEAEAVILFTTEPVPPMPLYMLVGGSAAAFIIGICLWLAPKLKTLNFLHLLTVPGRQTLTLYIAHIIIGMSALDLLGLLEGQTHGSALVASLVFCLIAMLFTLVWARFFNRGLLETLMRKLTG